MLKVEEICEPPFRAAFDDPSDEYLRAFEVIPLDSPEKSMISDFMNPDFSTFAFRPDSRHSVAKRLLILQTSLSSLDGRR
jgi:hypothetical protein